LFIGAHCRRSRSLFAPDGTRTLRNGIGPCDQECVWCGTVALPVVRKAWFNPFMLPRRWAGPERPGCRPICNAPEPHVDGFKHEE